MSQIVIYQVLLRGVIGLLVLLVLLNGLMYLQQPSMTFSPDKTLYQTPVSWRLAFENVQLTAANGERLHGWYIPCRDARKTLLFFHGNGGNISQHGESIEIFHRLGLNILIIDYRGFGLSEGSPSEQALNEDARLAWDYLTGNRGVSPLDIIVFGRSLGGAVAARLSSQVQPAALILESTLSSVRDMARDTYPLLSRIVWLRYRFPVADDVRAVRCPVLVLHSREDEMIPYRFGQRVFQAANAPKQFVELKGDHNGGFIRSQPGYQHQLQSFILKYANVQPAEGILSL